MTHADRHRPGDPDRGARQDHASTSTTPARSPTPSFHVTEFRGFEKFCEGRPFCEMPRSMARICGICPVSHLIASAKAGDAILAVRIPPTAAELRRLMNLAQIVQSHALSFFHLARPTCCSAWTADPATRNIFGLIAAAPRAGPRRHPPAAVRPGDHRVARRQEHPPGLGRPRRRPRAARRRERATASAAALPEALRDRAARARLVQAACSSASARRSQTFGNFPSLFMGLVGRRRQPGSTTTASCASSTPTATSSPTASTRATTRTTSARRSSPGLVPKSPYYKPLGYPDGIYRVGPLARLNICRPHGHAAGRRGAGPSSASASRAPCLSSFYYHYARLIEILVRARADRAAARRPGRPARPHVRAHAGVNSLEGVGVSEAPRGTLFHHYQVDDDGLITWANLIIATGQNNLAMNRGVLQIARHYVNGTEIPEGMLNRVEAGIRASTRA